MLGNKSKMFGMRRLFFVLLIAVISFIGYSFNKNVITSVSSKSLTVRPGIGTNIGDIAPELKYKNPEGKEIALSSLRGSFVLVDFWASWCGPCRMENPNVVAVYNKFKDKNFKIYSVSLDKNPVAWKLAIEKDGLNWPYHVSDLMGWQSEAAAIYGVNSIPANFLLNPKGIIIAKNLRGQDLGLVVGREISNFKASDSKTK